MPNRCLPSRIINHLHWLLFAGLLLGPGLTWGEQNVNPGISTSKSFEPP